MPGIQAIGFRLIVRTRGERGHVPHVHVERAEFRCTIVLDAELTPYDIHMRPRHVARARRLVKANFPRLQEWWNLYNGEGEVVPSGRSDPAPNERNVQKGGRQRKES